MGGIYIHVPFCKTRCVYCDFYTGADERLADAFVDAVCAEAKQRAGEVADGRVQTIYFGGGTPSRLREEHFEQIFDTIHELFRVVPDAEITLEANPDDLSADAIAALRRLPFNRISIGIQSFDDDMLRFLCRRHSAAQAAQAVKDCLRAGFDNITIDLMYGLPGQTMSMWRDSINRAVDLGVHHVSAYHLIYEEKTKLYSMKQAGKVRPVDEELSNAMFEELIGRLKANGFEHYEISNFARLGFVSQHNSSYWRGVPYLGLGPAAHSFGDGIRRSNVASLTKYIDGIRSGSPLFEAEIIGRDEQYNERIFTGLRTVWGVDLRRLEADFGADRLSYCLSNARKHIDSGVLLVSDGVMRLSQRGIFVSDAIMSDLMWV